MSESCHLVVTNALQTCVVFSWSHGGVSLAGRNIRGQGPAELQLDTAVVGMCRCRKWRVTAEGAKHHRNNKFV